MIGRAAVPLLLLALSSLGASARGASWTLPDLLAEMAAIESSEAVFRQEVHVSYLSEPMRYRGRVRYRAPDFMRMSYEEPERESVIFEADRVRVEQPWDGTERVLDLADQPSLKAVSQSLRATLSGNATELTAAFRVDFEGTADGWTLRLTPIDDEASSRISGITIGGTGHSILRYELVEADGDRMVFFFVPVK